jgi:predicted nucleic acid-binding protein
VYAHDRDTGDKHLRAIDLLAKLVRLRELTDSAQILNELASVLLRKRKIERSVVANAIAMLTARATVLPLTAELTALALGPGLDAGLSYWDALVWATAHANGIGVAYTEDFTHDRVISGVRFVDPFRPTGRNVAGVWARFWRFSLRAGPIRGALVNLGPATTCPASWVALMSFRPRDRDASGYSCSHASTICRITETPRL